MKEERPISGETRLMRTRRRRRRRRRRGGRRGGGGGGRTQRNTKKEQTITYLLFFPVTRLFEISYILLSEMRDKG